MKLPSFGRSPDSAASSTSSLLAAFEKYYDETWLPLGQYFDFHRLRFLHSLEYLDPLVPAGARVVDLGGIGPLAAFLRIERDAKVREVKSDLRYPFELPSDGFDLVLCTEVIEHIKDLDSTDIAVLERFNYSGVRSMLSEARRVLRPGGLLFVSTPNAVSWLVLFQWAHGKLPYLDNGHVREFTVETLTEVCAACGFSPQTLEVKDSWPNPFGARAAGVTALVGQMEGARGVERGQNIYGLFENT